MTAGRWSNAKIELIKRLRQERREARDLHNKQCRKAKRVRQKMFKAGRKHEWRCKARHSTETTNPTGGVGRVRGR